MNLTQENVNFMPDETVSERRRQGHLGFGLKVSIIFAVLAFSTLASIKFYNYRIQSEINSLNVNIDKQRVIIDGLHEFAVKGYQLGVRLEAVKNTMQSKLLYSRLLREVNTHVPEDVSVLAMTMTGLNDLLITGEALFNYAPVALYGENLLGNPNVFKDVKIIHASNVGERDAVKFRDEVVITENGINELPVDIVDVGSTDPQGSEGVAQ